MKENALAKIVTPYDVQGITDLSKKRLGKIILQISIYAVLLVLSVLAIVLLSEHLWVFILGIVVACISALMCVKQLKQIKFSDYSNALGEISNVHKDIKIVDTTSVGGINPFGTRKYDSYKNNEIRISVFIKEGEEIRTYYLNGATEEQAEYYEAKGISIHIWGTHFPVKLDIGKEQWLCPICGEFNGNEEKTCKRCNNKIIK